MHLNELSIDIAKDELETSSEWSKQDTTWMLSLYGTAIGAGTLFLPINVGLHGIIPLIIMALIAFPMTYFSHRALCRFVLSGSKSGNITDVVNEHFGAKAGNIITWLYFFAIYPILLMYTVALTNTTNSFLIHQLHLNSPPRIVLATVLTVALMAIVHYGQTFIVKFMSLLVYPFVCILMLLAIYLIPYWNTAVLHTTASTDTHGLLITLWLILPVMVFSFNHSPIISSFAVSQKKDYGREAEKKCSTILKYSHVMMVITVLFFVFSCVFSLSPTELFLAKKQNISILSYLANHFHTPVIAYIAPIIAFIAISKSFFGHYLGAKEGLQGIVNKALVARGKSASNKKTELLIELFMLVSCIIVATLNPSILAMIEVLGGPIIAFILFIMPAYAMKKVPSMYKYRQFSSDWFIITIGLISISAILYGIF